MSKLFVALAITSVQFLTLNVRALISWAALLWFIFGVNTTFNAWKNDGDVSWWWLLSVPVLMLLWLITAMSMGIRLKFINDFLEEHSFPLGAGLPAKALSNKKAKFKWSGSRRVPSSILVKGSLNDITVKKLVSVYTYLHNQIEESGLSGAYRLDLSRLSGGIVKFDYVNEKKSESEVKYSQDLFSILKMIDNTSYFFKNYDSIKFNEQNGTWEYDPEEVLSGSSLEKIEKNSEGLLKGSYSVEQNDGTVVVIHPIDPQVKNDMKKSLAFLERLWKHVANESRAYSLRLDQVNVRDNSIIFSFDSDSAVGQDEFAKVEKLLKSNLKKKFQSDWVIYNNVLDDGVIVAQLNS